VLDTKRQTNQSNSNVDVTDGKMFLGKHERHDLIIINRGVVRNVSRGGGLIFFPVGGQHPFGPENPLKSIDFSISILIWSTSTHG